MDVCLKPSQIRGRLIAQPSKSDAHRRLICTAFAKGKSVVENIVLSDDIIATLQCVQLAGCSYKIQSSLRYSDRKRILITGTGGMSNDNISIDCGESGSTLRFMTMVLAASGGKAVLDGGGRLPVRPMEGAIRLLKENGFECTYPGNGKYLPLTIKGKLHGSRYEIDSSITSQYLSGLLMALPAFSKSGEILATGQFESKGYVEVTKKIIKDYGICIEGSNPYTIPENKGYEAFDSEVEGDWSNASYFLSMKALGADIEVSGLNEDSVQPDAAINNHIDDIIREKSPVVDVSESPDIMPTIAVLGASMNKTLKIIGGRRLRAKESDRIAAVAAGLENLGVRTKQSADGLTVLGTGKITGGIVDACNDHRIAMAFATLCSVAENDIVITGAGSVSKSYPQFFEDIKMLGGIVV